MAQLAAVLSVVQDPVFHHVGLGGNAGYVVVAVFLPCTYRTRLLSFFRDCVSFRALCRAL